MLFLQGTVIVIILPALASKPYRVDVNQYVLNSFNQFQVTSVLVILRHQDTRPLTKLDTRVLSPCHVFAQTVIIIKDLIPAMSKYINS